jgi:hypothetical protein
VPTRAKGRSFSPIRCAFAVLDMLDDVGCCRGWANEVDEDPPALADGAEPLPFPSAPGCDGLVHVLLYSYHSTVASYGITRSFSKDLGSGSTKGLKIDLHRTPEADSRHTVPDIISPLSSYRLRPLVFHPTPHLQAFRPVLWNPRFLVTFSAYSVFARAYGPVWELPSHCR